MMSPCFVQPADHGPQNVKSKRKVKPFENNEKNAECALSRCTLETHRTRVRTPTMSTSVSRRGRRAPSPSDFAVRPNARSPRLLFP